MSATLFPYAELQGTVSLRVTSVTLNGRRMPWEAIFENDLVVELRNPDAHSWETGAIEVEVTGPAAELQARSGDLSHVRVVAVLNCGATNYRLATELVAAGDSCTWTGTIDLDRADWFGTATLGATIVATIEGVDDRQAGFAPGWSVRFDDLPPREINNAMRVLWENFGEPAGQNHAFLAEYADDICFLRLDPDEPLLFLNEGFSGLRLLLEDKPGRPEAHRILRTQVLTDIASSTWHALFMASLEALEVDEEGQLGLPPQDWQGNVLDALLPRLYPNSAPEEARRDAWEARRDPAAAAGLQERLLPAVSRHVQQPKALRAALQKIVDPDRENP